MAIKAFTLCHLLVVDEREFPMITSNMTEDKVAGAQATTTKIYRVQVIEQIVAKMNIDLVADAIAVTIRVVMNVMRIVDLAVMTLMVAIIVRNVTMIVILVATTTSHHQVTVTMIVEITTVPVVMKAEEIVTMIQSEIVIEVPVVMKAVVETIMNQVGIVAEVQAVTIARVITVQAVIMMVITIIRLVVEVIAEDTIARVVMKVNIKMNTVPVEGTVIEDMTQKEVETNLAVEVTRFRNESAKLVAEDTTLQIEEKEVGVKVDMRHQLLLADTQKCLSRHQDMVLWAEVEEKI